MITRRKALKRFAYISTLGIFVPSAFSQPYLLNPALLASNRSSSDGGGAPCTTLREDGSAFTGSDFAFNQNAFDMEHLFQFTANNTGNRCAVDVRLARVGTAPGNFRIRLISDVLDVATAQIGATALVACSTLTTSVALYNIALTAPVPLVNGTKYWISIECDTTGDASNHIITDWDFPAGLHWYDPGADAWENYGSTGTMFYKLYSQ